VQHLYLFSCKPLRISVSPQPMLGQGVAAKRKCLLALGESLEGVALAIGSCGSQPQGCLRLSEQGETVIFEHTGPSIERFRE
jgi:hypothetical protein